VRHLSRYQAGYDNKPASGRKPHPPIHVGGASPHGARRAIRYGDDWIPIDRGGDLGDLILKFREMAQDAGRLPNSIEISPIVLAENVESIKRYAEMGFSRVIAWFPPEKADAVLPIVDRWTKILRSVAGAQSTASGFEVWRR
jgi:alkanesulfonate monooxygenase SsuD/methylene tetrahydromethanopterin reductase-like flavin-dependent oxidoreductase (luciferase family)